MLGVGMWTTIKTLKGQGKNKSQIARITRHDWKTVSKVIKSLEAGRQSPKPQNRKSNLDPFKAKLLELLEKGLSGVRIHEELSIQGFKGSYSGVKKFIRKLKRREKIFIRIHTEPAQEAQVDFGYVGLTPDNKGKLRRTWVFNMRLSHSRYDYYEKVYNQKVETFIQCHINAFDYFHGVPKTVRIDNLKAAILEANFYEPVYQKVYKDFVNYYGFQSIPCRVYKPNDKGKVESGIKYVKCNFFKGRNFLNGKDLEQRLKEWNNAANNRVHGTTRKVPYQIFIEQEKQYLTTLPDKPFELVTPGRRKVYHDCHIYVDYNYYSVPFEYIGKMVDIELNKFLLRVYYDDKEIAIHNRLPDKGSFSTVKAHYPAYKIYSEDDYRHKYKAKMAKVGEYAEQMFMHMTEKNSYWQRATQGILSLTKRYSKNVVNLACKRALAHQAYYYRIVKSICEKGAYNLPVDFNN